MDIEQFEFDQLTRSYHEHCDLVGKGITLYLIVVFGCLTIPNSVHMEPATRQDMFREMCRVFAIVVSLGFLAAYGAASAAFWKMHQRTDFLSRKLQISSPPTWLLPLVVWLACGLAAVLLVLISRYS